MSKSDNESDPQPGMTLETKLSQEHRLCHMVKRPDFDGYGFNLHSEKGKPGQYIGKVDEKSPAEESGLRQGDRIIEVNGVNIGNETHKQVVQRIKAIENEVRLLVVDPDVETRVKQQHQKEQQVASNKEGSPVQNNNNNTSNSKTSSPTSSLKTQQINNNRTSISTTSSVDSSSNGQETATLTATPSPSPPPKQVESNSVQNGVSNNSNSSNGTAKMATTGSSSTGLNLKMTAAEMRAKLQARKKYDPKNDSVDLRKKFDIIQKL